MENDEMAVARYKDGRVLKGYVRNFQVDSDVLLLREPQAKEELSVAIDQLKAIFFVKDFTGSYEYVERKSFGIRKSPGRKVFVKFSDDESLLGYIVGEVPWDKGFSLAKLSKNAKGFFLTPVDGGSNNSRVFVVGSAIKDITIMTV
jgi:hypothetical protein